MSEKTGQKERAPLVVRDQRGAKRDAGAAFLDA
jgi:hypothetical protein